MWLRTLKWRKILPGWKCSEFLMLKRISCMLIPLFIYLEVLYIRLTVEFMNYESHFPICNWFSFNFIDYSAMSEMNAKSMEVCILMLYSGTRITNVNNYMLPYFTIFFSMSIGHVVGDRAEFKSTKRKMPSEVAVSLTFTFVEVLYYHQSGNARKL